MTEENLEKGKKLIKDIKNILDIEKEIYDSNNWIEILIGSELGRGFSFSHGINDCLDEEAIKAITSLVRSQITKKRIKLQQEFANL